MGGGGGCRRGSYALLNGHSATGPGMNWSLLLLGCSLLACADEHKVHTLRLKISSELFARLTFLIIIYSQKAQILSFVGIYYRGGLVTTL